MLEMGGGGGKEEGQGEDWEETETEESTGAHEQREETWKQRRGREACWMHQMLQLMITYCLESFDNLVARAHRGYRECLPS
jgi:hypothetical protein